MKDEVTGNDGGVRTGEIIFQHVRGKTAVTTAYARYPSKFVVARRAAEGDCAWVYVLGYGGGMVCGDRVSLSCHVGPACSAVMATQGHTKIYKRRKSHSPAKCSMTKVLGHRPGVLAAVETGTVGGTPNLGGTGLSRGGGGELV
ncbi:unnamed protein product, partial [Discosporangium mesarthrocarpum]